MHWAIWIITALLVGLWSLLAWGLHALLGIDIRISGDIGAWLDQLPMSAWLDAWAPAWRELVLASLQLVQAVLAWLGSASGWIVALVWGIGAALLVFTALLLSALVALIRRTMPPAQPRPA